MNTAVKRRKKKQTEAKGQKPTWLFLILFAFSPEADKVIAQRAKNLVIGTATFVFDIILSNKSILTDKKLEQQLKIRLSRTKKAVTEANLSCTDFLEAVNKGRQAAVTKRGGEEIPEITQEVMDLFESCATTARNNEEED